MEIGAGADSWLIHLLEMEKLEQKQKANQDDWVKRGSQAGDHPGVPFKRQGRL